MADKKLIGRATVIIAGVPRRTVKGVTFNPGGIARTSVQTFGYTEEDKASKLDGEFPFGKGDSLSDFDGGDVTIQFQADTGQVYSVPSAWRTDVPDLTDNGTVKVTFEGEPALEIS